MAELARCLATALAPQSVQSPLCALDVAPSAQPVSSQGPNAGLQFSLVPERPLHRCTWASPKHLLVRKGAVGFVF